MEKTIKGNWGAVFASAMEEQGISADKISIDLKIPKRSIYAYLSGTEPTATRFLQITNYLKITL